MSFLGWWSCDDHHFSQYSLELEDKIVFNFYKTFRADEGGAVTVDWVVLTALIVGLGIAVLTTIGSGTAALGDKISSALSAQTIATY
jgi:Flp pilus assembly pilin Flp